VFDRVPTKPTRYVHVLAGAGDPTLEIKAGGPISAFVEAAGEATKTILQNGSGSHAILRSIFPETQKTTVANYG